jgi:tetratricopeptide (TPR) repeat protein
MRCPRCRHDNPARVKFCLECGQRLAHTCLACGAELPETAKFCPECGRPVAAAGAAALAEPARPGPEARTPATYTPRHLAERILTSRGALEGERKPVTVLFCDLVGSTALAERLGAEGMHILVNSFFETALAEVHRYEGTVNQFLGDGFMALFGAPLAYEDHARRAALAAVGVARALRDRPMAVTPGIEITLTVRMGLHTGFVVVGARDGGRSGRGQGPGQPGRPLGGHKDYERGLSLSREAVAAAEGAGDAPDARRASAEAHLRVGLMGLNLARMMASRGELTRALTLFREAGDVHGEGRALDVLAVALMIAGDLDASLAHAQEALPRLVESGDRQTEASCLSNVAWVLFLRGRRAESEPWITRALEAARAIGARAQEAHVHAAAGQLAEPYGEWGRAFTYGETALATARELGHHEWTAAALAVLARVRRNCGDNSGALACHKEMLGIAQELRTALWLAEALSELGQDLLAAGEITDGARRLDEAIEAAREAVQFTLRPCSALANLALQAGRPDEALGHLARLEPVASQFALLMLDPRRAGGEALVALDRRDEGEARLRAVAAAALRRDRARGRGARGAY